MTECLWCRRKFEWDSLMFQFCDDCLTKLDIIDSLTGNYDFWPELEEKLRQLKGG